MLVLRIYYYMVTEDHTKDRLICQKGRPFSCCSFMSCWWIESDYRLYPLLADVNESLQLLNRYIFDIALLRTVPIKLSPDSLAWRHHIKITFQMEEDLWSINILTCKWLYHMYKRLCNSFPKDWCQSLFWTWILIFIICKPEANV